MSGQTNDTTKQERRDGDRRGAKTPYDGPDRRQAERRSGKERRGAPRI